MIKFSTSALAAVFAAIAASATAHEARAEQASTSKTEMVSVIVYHLPLKTSRAYHALRRLSGVSQRQILVMSKSEVWTVPRANIEVLRQAAKVQGSDVMILDGQSNRLPVPTKSRKPADL